MLLDQAASFLLIGSSSCQHKAPALNRSLSEHLNAYVSPVGAADGIVAFPKRGSDFRTALRQVDSRSSWIGRNSSAD
jgi:hypothetical protein